MTDENPDHPPMHNGERMACHRCMLRPAVGYAWLRSDLAPHCARCMPEDDAE